MFDNNFSYLSSRHYAVYQQSSSRLIERLHSYGTMDTPVQAKTIKDNSLLPTIYENIPFPPHQEQSKNSLCTRLCNSFSSLFKQSYTPNSQEATQNE